MRVRNFEGGVELAGEGGGRPPVPTAIKKLRGTDQPSRRNLREPKTVAKLSRVLPHMTEEARALWRSLGKDLEAMGVISESDRIAFAVLCDAWAEYLEAKEMAKTQGTTITTEKGYVMEAPWMIRAHKLREQILKLSREFGLTPSARVRVSAVEPAREADAFDEFLQGQSA